MTPDEMKAKIVEPTNDTVAFALRKHADTLDDSPFGVSSFAATLRLAAQRLESIPLPGAGRLSKEQLEVGSAYLCVCETENRYECATWNGSTFFREMDGVGIWFCAPEFMRPIQKLAALAAEERGDETC